MRVAMISVPKGLLRLAALRLLSESSLSGANLREEIVRASKGSWNPGPGSIYFMMRELLKKAEVSRQLRLQSFYSFLAGRVDIQKKVEELADSVRRVG